MTFEQVYNKRKERGRNVSWRTDKIKGLLSKELNVEQKFSNVSDLLDEFNKYGFHDVCNSLSVEDVGSSVEIS